jgi:hypothetical protein
MKCQRCVRGEEATDRVRSDVIDMKVCAACADEARRLGLLLKFSVRKKEKALERRAGSRFAITGQNSCSLAHGEALTLPSLSSFFC